MNKELTQELEDLVAEIRAGHSPHNHQDVAFHADCAECVAFPDWYKGFENTPAR